VGGVAAQFFTNTGAVLTGGKLYTYLAGTTTPATTYTTSVGNVARTNPIILDAAGRVPGSGEIWLTVGIAYKFVLKDSTDVLIATYDNVNSIDASQISYDPPFASSVITNVEAKLSEIVSVKDFGAVGNGSTNDTAAIQAALTTGCTVLFPSGTYLISSTVTLTGAFLFEKNALLKIATGQTVTLNGSVQAGLYQIFDQTGTPGKVLFALNSVTEIYPQWWGAVVDGTTNDQPAMQACINSALASSVKVAFSGHLYITSPLKISNTNVPNWIIFEITGQLSGSAVGMTQGNNNGTCILTNGCTAFDIEFYSYFNESVKMEKFGMRNIGAAGTTSAILIKKNSTNYIRKQMFYDLNIVGFGTGIYFKGENATFVNNYIGLTIFNALHIYTCQWGIKLDNVYMNMMELGNSLIQNCGTAVYPGGGLVCINQGGGIFSVRATHFDGCEPAAIVTDVRYNIIDLNAVTGEVNGVISTKGFLDLGVNTALQISGLSQVPGTGEPVSSVQNGNSVGRSSFRQSTFSTIAYNDFVDLNLGSIKSNIGFITVRNSYTSDAERYTQTIYAICNRGTALVATPIATQNGTTGAFSFSLSMISAGVLRVTNTNSITGLGYINVTYISSCDIFAGQ
jgi:hypothetical protein